MRRRIGASAAAVALFASVPLVNPPPALAAPANDDFANATVLSGSGITQGPDSNIGATKETGEPDHAADPGGASAWYNWTAPGSGTVLITTAGSSFDTVLGVYTGSSVSSLTEVAGNDDDPTIGCCTSRVRYQIAAATTYRIAVDGNTGATGTIWVHLTFDPRPVNDAFVNAIVLSSSAVAQGPNTSSGATKESGEPKHAGATGGASIWYQWTAPYSGATVITTAGSSFDTVLGVYTGPSVSSTTEVASNDDDPTIGCCTSRVTFTATASTEYRIAVDGWAGATGAVRLGITLASVIPNDFFVDARVLAGTSATEGPDSNVSFTKEAGEPDHAGNSGGASAWYRWTASSRGTVVVTTDGSDFDTVMGVYTGSGVGALTTVASNDNYPLGGVASRAEFSVTSGTTYSIAVDRKPWTTGGNIVFNLSFEPPAVTADITIAGLGDTTLGSGSVSDNTTNVCGPSTGTQCGPWTYDEGANLLLTATPDAGSVFSGWIGDCAFANPSNVCNINPLGANVNTTAQFTKVWDITLTKSGTGDGLVEVLAPTPDATFCPVGCTTQVLNDVPDGSVVAFLASPNATSTFTGWGSTPASPLCTLIGGLCQLTVSANTTVNADFAAITHTLTVTKSGPGSGTVTSAPLGIDCGPNCDKAFIDGTVVTLTATPNPTSVFSGWSGSGCSGTGTCVVTMDVIHTVDAAFTGATPTHQPDGTVRLKGGVSFLGYHVYNSTAVGQVATGKAAVGERVTFNIKIQNDGMPDADTFTISGAKTTKRVAIRYFDGSGNITAAVVAGTYTTVSIAAESGVGTPKRAMIRVVMIGRRSGISKQALITVTSVTDPSKVDAVGTKLVVTRGVRSSV